MQAVLLLVLLAFKLATYGSFGYSHGPSLVQASWESPAMDEKLLHMTVDELSGHKRVYIGAVNKIYQLSSDLKLEAQALMGPALDSYECPVTGNCPNIELKPMNYYNKALVIHSPSYTPKTNASHPMPYASTLPFTATPTTSANSFHFSPLISSTQSSNYFNVSSQQASNTQPTTWLISCGTLYQGVCALHSLDNITKYEILANESVVPNSLYASTVAFIAPGPTDPLTKRQPQVLYVGASYSGFGPYSAEVPAVSSRSLHRDKLFNIASTNVASGTRLTVNALAKDKFPINYVYGFASKGFSYFVTVQRKTMNSPQPFITKIARVCQNDANYHSYVETQLVCGKGDVDYNLAQAAYVGKPGPDLAESFGITTNDDLLYVVFAKSTDKREIFNEPSQQSALCVYSLKHIQSTFTQNIQYCFNGNGDQGLDFISQTQQCSQTQVQIYDDFCGMDANHLINGHFPVEATPVMTYSNVSITAVAASPTNDFTVAYLGTSTGQLRRVVVETLTVGYEYSSPVVDPQRRTAINSDMLFDRRDESADFLYIMNDKKIYLIKLQECNQYKTCSECLRANDPHCGWCSAKNQCSVRSSCLESHPNQDNLLWFSHRKGKCDSTSSALPSHIQDPVLKTLESSITNTRILSIVPSKGPKSGGTKLVIWGLDMDVGTKVEAYLEDNSAPCEIISRQKDRVECLTSPVEVPGQKRVILKFDDVERSFYDYKFLYAEDPEIDAVTSQAAANHHSRAGFIYPPPKGIVAGGITIYVKGKNFISIQEPKFYVIADGSQFSAPCQVENDRSMSCLTPSVPEDRLSSHRLSTDEPAELDYGFLMDNVAGVHKLATRPDNRLPMFLMFSNPEFKPFPEEVKYYKGDYLTINGSNLDRASSETDITVKIGNGFCNVTSLSRTQLTCKPPLVQPEALNWRGQLDNSILPDVVVIVGTSLNFTIGKISYDSSEGLDNIFSKSILFLMVISVCFLVMVVVVILIAYRRKASESNKVVKTMQERMDVLEMKVASEAKQAFTELQTEMTDLTDDLEHGGIPYLDYRIYAMKVLFPNQTDHPVLSEMQIDPKIRASLEEGLDSFGQLILNKTFLLIFIRTLESNRYFSMRDRVNVASLIMVTLQNKMEYCTDILKTLLSNLIEKSMESRSHPKLLLRRTESVAERMLSSWFTFLLYKFLRECAGEPLFLLYQAIKHQVNKGPVDVITSEARCTLSEEKLIRQSVEYKTMTVHVSMLPQTAYLSGVDPNLQTGTVETPVKVLDCDAISQVKEKAIDTIYKSAPYSQRPPVDNLDIEWRASPTARILMADRDHTNKTEGYCKRINTLSHYRVPDNASLSLVTKQTSIYDMTMAMNDKHRYETLSHFGFGKTISSALSRPTSPLIELDDGFKYWHLVKHHDNDNRGGERSSKMVSEIYLTRLLATKGTLQRFVDDLFETIFSTARLTSSLPIAIKYMFDFLDDQAHSHGIRDPEVVHTWKSNSLPLRFWVNLIKNPNFVFDINKSHIVDSCLSVVAQTFMDACSKSEHRLGKDSPSSKLLYAKDLPIYKDWVERYYNEIAMIPPINEHDMNAMLAEESRQHAHEFNVNVSLHELFKYAVKYQEQLIIALDEDEFARKSRLAAKFRQTMLKMNVDNNLYF